MGRAQGDSSTLLVARREHSRSSERWQQLLSARYPAITWEIGQIDPLAAASVARQFERLAAHYPLALEALAYVGVVTGDPQQPYGDGCWAQSYSDRIELNPHYFADQELLVGELVAAEAERWHPRGCDSVESIVSHEYGHVLYRRLENEKEHALTDGVTVTGFGTVGGTLAAWLRRNDPRHVSVYARSNDEEAFAEGFTSLVHTPPARRCAYVKGLDALLTVLLDRHNWHRSRGLGVLAGAERQAAEERLGRLAATLGLPATVR